MSNVPAIQSGYEVEMGTKVGALPIDKYKATEAKKDIITVLSTKPIITKTMYHDNIGFRFHALPEGADFGLQTFVHYNFIIAVWEANSKGNKVVSNDYELKVLSVADRVYQRLVSKYDIHGNLNKLCLQVACEDEKFQSMTFEVLDFKPPFMASKELFKTIQQEFTSYKEIVPLVVASPLKTDKFRELWNAGIKGEASAPTEEEKKEFGAKKPAIVDNVIEDVDFEESFDDAPEQDTPQRQLPEANSGKKKKQQPPKVESEPSNDKESEFFGDDEDFQFD